MHVSRSKVDQSLESSNLKFLATTSLRSASTSPTLDQETNITSTSYKRQLVSDHRSVLERSKSTNTISISSEHNDIIPDNRLSERIQNPQEASKPKFYAPDLMQRSRSFVTSDKSTKKNSTGRTFRNLQHMNNARKLAASKQQPPPAPRLTLNTSPTTTYSSSNMFLSDSDDSSKIHTKEKVQEETLEPDMYISGTSGADRSHQPLAKATLTTQRNGPEDLDKNIDQSFLEACSSNSQSFCAKSMLSDLTHLYDVVKNPLKVSTDSAIDNATSTIETQPVQTQTVGCSLERTTQNEEREASDIESTAQDGIDKPIRKTLPGRFSEPQLHAKSKRTPTSFEKRSQSIDRNLFDQLVVGKGLEEGPRALSTPTPPQIFKTDTHKNQQLQEGYDEEAKVRRTWVRGEMPSAIWLEEVLIRRRRCCGTPKVL